MIEGQLGGEQRAADGPHGPARQGLAPGQAEAALVLAGQVAAQVALDVAAVVGQGEDVM